MVDRGVLHRRGPVNEDPGSSRWHRGNVGEALPGVSTPLNADFWRPSMESSLLGSFHRLGLADARERGGEDGLGSAYAGRICRFFYGRLASDFDIVLELFARMPGVDAALLEEQFLGKSSGVERPRPSPVRGGIAVTKSAAALTMLPRLVGRRTAATDAWWRDTTARSAKPDAREARARFDDARLRMRHDLELQITVAMLQAALVDQLGTAVERATGTDELVPVLVAGITGIEEAGMMDGLWGVARDGGRMDEFVARYGFYGPDEGELSAHSWREDVARLTSVLDGYRSMPEEDRPATRVRARAAAAQAGRARVLAAASGRDRVSLRVLIPAARRYTALREEGKALMLRCIDAGRAAARRVGAHLVADGVLEEVDDVFFLTRAELDSPPTDPRGVVAGRRAQHAEYQEILLPLAFAGAELRALVDAAATATPSRERSIEGLGVSPGIAEGTARVVTDPLDGDAFLPGDVLVCATTDPGWSPLLSLACGVVLDVGSMLSHGAIVARELGVPCVANTTDGTRRIPDGARVRIDGTAGAVTILERPDRAEGSAA